MDKDLNLETAKISWQELQPHFARGVVVVVSKELDLIQTAHHFADDNADIIQQKLNTRQVHKAELEDASHWNETDAVLWAVVVAPWVLVQEQKIKPINQ